MQPHALAPEKCGLGTLVSVHVELRYPNSYFLKENTAAAITVHWCRSTAIKCMPLPCPMRFEPIFCQILPGEQRDLLSHSVRKLLFLSHNRNPDSNVPPRFVSSVRVMPISPSFGLVSDWMKPIATFSWPEKQKSEDTPSAWSFLMEETWLCFSASTFVEAFETEVSQQGFCAGSSISQHEKVQWIQMFWCKEAASLYASQWCNLAELNWISLKVQCFLEMVRFVIH